MTTEQRAEALAMFRTLYCLSAGAPLDWSDLELWESIQDGRPGRLRGYSIHFVEAMIKVRRAYVIDEPIRWQGPLYEF